MRAACDAGAQQAQKQTQPESVGDETHAIFYHGASPPGRARCLPRATEEIAVARRSDDYMQSTQTLHSSVQTDVALLPAPRSHCSPSASSTLPSPQKCGNLQPGEQPSLLP